MPSEALSIPQQAIGRADDLEKPERHHTEEDDLHQRVPVLSDSSLGSSHDIDSHSKAETCLEIVPA